LGIYVLSVTLLISSRVFRSPKIWLETSYAIQHPFFSSSCRFYMLIVLI